MDIQNELQRMKRQRNRAACAAVAIIVISMASLFPSALARRKRLHAAHDELLSVQAQIETTQMQIKRMQVQIIDAELEARTLLNELHVDHDSVLPRDQRDKAVACAALFSFFALEMVFLGGSRESETEQGRKVLLTQLPPALQRNTTETSENQAPIGLLRQAAHVCSQ